jgi:chaperonin GroEL
VKVGAATGVALKERKYRTEDAHLPAGHGLNAVNGQYVDMVRVSIAEPAKVTRLALRNGASIAALFLTIEVVIADNPT